MTSGNVSRFARKPRRFPGRRDGGAESVQRPVNAGVLHRGIIRSLLLGPLPLSTLGNFGTLGTLGTLSGRGAPAASTIAVVRPPRRSSPRRRRRRPRNLRPLPPRLPRPHPPPLRRAARAGRRARDRRPRGGRPLPARGALLTPSSSNIAPFARGAFAGVGHRAGHASTGSPSRGAAEAGGNALLTARSTAANPGLSCTASA